MDFGSLYHQVLNLFGRAMNFRFTFNGTSYPLYVPLCFILAIGLVWYLLSSWFGISSIPDTLSRVRGD